VRDIIRWSGDGTALYWLTQTKSEFLELVKYEVATGRQTSLTSGMPWDVEVFDVSDDGRTIAFVTNEDGWSRIHLLEAASGHELPFHRLKSGVITKVAFRPRSQEFAFVWAGESTPAGLYSYDVASGQTGAWMAAVPASGKMVDTSEPVSIRYPTFDARLIPAFLRRPGPKFRGRRPVDERDPEMSQFLHEISPLTHASQIRSPLLVIHGVNDPRVPLRQSEDIVSAVRRNGVPVWYVRFDGEGHGLAVPDDHNYANNAKVLFLRRHLLGEVVK
jgi:dipeptidyl aminopeptidase/acylaminoacyl peptidase